MEPIVLSLGKLAAGQAGYYLDQAQGTTTRAQAVASGVEDYYLGGHEAKGRWAGAGAAALGLRGEVAHEPLLRVLAGEHPATGDPLGRVLASRRPGFDLTFRRRSPSACCSGSVTTACGQRSRRRTTRRSGMRSDTWSAMRP